MGEAMVPHSVMVSQINAAVAAEREQCAKVADEHARTVDLTWPENNLQLIAGEEIAIKIRARGSK